MRSTSSPIPCRPIGNSNIRRDDNHRLFIVNDSIIRLTPTEYRLVKLLLENHLVDDTTLIKEAMQYPNMTKIDKQTFRTLERHIENIKSKLEDFPLTIRRVQRYGYALVPS